MSTQITEAIDGVVTLLEKAVTKGAHSAEEIKELHLQVASALTPLARATATIPTPAVAPVAAPSEATAIPAPAAPQPKLGTAALLAAGLRTTTMLIDQFYKMSGNMVMMNAVAPQLEAVRKSIEHL